MGDLTIGFEDLIADMLDISDEERNEDSDVVIDEFENEFSLDYDLTFMFVKQLLDHVPPIKTGLTGTVYKSFISKNEPLMLMRMLMRKEVSNG